MIKGTPPATKPHTTATSSVKKKGQPSTTGIKIPVPKSKAGTPLTSQEETDLAQRLEALRERRKTLEKKLSETSSWGKGKGKGKGKGPLALERLKPLSGWEDWAQGKSLDAVWSTTRYEEEKEQYLSCLTQEEKEEKETCPKWLRCGRLKMVGENGHRISLARLSEHGTRHAFGETA